MFNQKMSLTLAKSFHKSLAQSLFVSAFILTLAQAAPAAVALDFDVITSGIHLADGKAPKIVKGVALTEEGATAIVATTEAKPRGEDSVTTVVRASDNKELKGTFPVLSGIEPKKVKVANITTETIHRLDKPIEMTLDEKKYRVEREISADRKTLSVALVSLNGKTPARQVLYTCALADPKALFCGDDGFQELTWAGDIDGDKKLDLVMILSEKYSVRPYHLFLSKEARAGDLVKQAGLDRELAR